MTLPAVPWIDSPELDAHLDAIAADVETRAFAHALARDGLASLQLGPELTPLLDQVVRDMTPWLARSGARRAQDLWRRSAAVRQVAGWPPLLSRIEQVYGRKPFAFQTLCFGRGSEQPAHSDAMHFQSDPPGFMCGVWIALEDVRPESGPLTYYPGSHRFPYPEAPESGAAGCDDSAFVARLVERLTEAALPVTRATPRKGQAVVWVANLAHGGSPIRDPASTRRSLVIHYFFEGCGFHTPVAVRFQPGRRRWRLPVDMATGTSVWPMRDGRRLPVRLDQRLVHLFHKATRRVLVH